MTRSLPELLDELEGLTSRLVERSANPGNCDIEVLKSEIRERATLIRQISEKLRVKPAVNYPEFNRLLALHVQGTQIEANLRRIRASIVSRLNRSSRDRRYAERLADQIAMG